MRTKGLVACLFFIVFLNDAYAQAENIASQKSPVKKRMEIDVRPDNRSLVGCLVPAFRAAGREYRWIPKLAPIIDDAIKAVRK